MKENILICSPSWLGDCIMSMPAVQSLKKSCGGCSVTVLSKAKMASLWGMNRSVDDIITLEAGPTGTLRTANVIRKRNLDLAVIFPNSFRSAFIPFLAGIPARRGVAGHFRRRLLSEIVVPSSSADRCHQSWEYLAVAGSENVAYGMEMPSLDIPHDAMNVLGRLGIEADGQLYIGFMPGAARGVSKRWPPEYFGEVGRLLVAGTGCKALVFGSAGEKDLCEEVAGRIGVAAKNVAGVTTIPEFAALCRICSTVVANDSGGMHLAAAAGVPVVAVFGATDPAKTGPMGGKHKLMFERNVAKSRDIARYSKEAERILRSIQPGRIVTAVMEVLGSSS